MKNSYHLFLIVLLVGCDNPKLKNILSKENPCDYCKQENFIYPTSIDSNAKGKTIISEPVAIEFFNVYDTLAKYSLSNRIDSLSYPFIYKDMRGQKLINWDNLHYYTEQPGIYSSEIQPFLDSIKVKQIKGNLQDSIISFVYNEELYTVDITYFNNEDGVIFFTPGKKPIYWKQRNFKEGCSYKDYAKCYFTK